METSPWQTRFKNLDGKSERENPKRTISASGGLDGYKWYQSQTPDDVPARRLTPKEVDTRRCANKDAGPQRGWTQGGVPTRTLGPKKGGHEAVYQQGHWPQRGVDWRVPQRLEKGTSASEDAGP